MNKLIRLLVPLMLLVVLAAQAQAQGRLIYHDEVNRLERTRIERAAQPLIERGARVAVYALPTGNEQTFQDRLEQDGLARNGLVESNMIAIFVAFNPPYSSIRYGDRWNEALGTNNNYEAIRSNQLNAGLSAGRSSKDYTRGFVDALAAIERSIVSPPVAGGGTSINVGSGTFLPIVLGIVFLVLLFVLGPMLWGWVSRRRAAAQAFAHARQTAEDARRQAGAAIADLGQLLNDARAKAEYDKLSYPTADVEQLAKLQAAAESQFAQAQEQFDAASEALAAKQSPTQADYEANAAANTKAAQEIAAARELLTQAEARRAELDKLNAAAPEAIDRSKKALADVAERISGLGGEVADPAAILRSIETQVANAESLFGEHRAADAIAATEAASAAIDELAQFLTNYSDIREGISSGRAGAEKAATQGYRIEGGLACFTTAEERLRQAAQTLEQRGVKDARPFLEQAEAARAEGVMRGGGMPALRSKNDERLPKIQQTGAQLASYIVTGRQTFDKVDEFAESTWSDIRGNGSEAEAAAARAHALWERASQRNTMERQEFLDAAHDLDAAEEQITYACSLVDTIVQRLKDLEAARAAAKEEIAAAKADIEKGWNYVHTNDPDIGKEPEQALTQAAALLTEAETELAKPRPDWLAIVKQAQEANRLADKALAGAQDEVEAMGKLRDQVGRAQQLAVAEVQKLTMFVSLHRDDIPSSSKPQLQALQSEVQSAYDTFKATEQIEDQQRAAALREALVRYPKLQANAEQLYTEVYAAFEQIEKLRKSVAKEAKQAQRAIDHAEQVRQKYTIYISKQSEGIALLEQARTALASIGVVQDEADKERGLKAALTARQAAERAEAIFYSEAPDNHDDNDAGEFIAGAAVGALLNSARHGHGSGWGGSWGSSSSSSSHSSSSGSSWGHGGGGGGSWGGGGGGGGGWGGGGGGGGGGW